MRLIAIQDTVDVYAPNGSTRQVQFGQYVGDLKQNSNDGFLVLTSNEKVDIDAVAIDNSASSETTTSVPIQKSTFETNQPIQGSVAKINTTDRNIRLRKLIALGLTGGGVYFFFNGRKSLGITMFIFGIIMLKRTK